MLFPPSLLGGGGGISNKKIPFLIFIESFLPILYLFLLFFFFKVFRFVLSAVH